MSDQAARLRQLMSGMETTTPIPCRMDGRASVTGITSGKGGVGKTMLAVNLAVAIAESGRSVLIVDADLGLANVDVMLGMEPGRHMGHLLLADCRAEDVAIDGPCGIKVIAGGSGLRELADADGDQRRLLLAKLRSYYDNFDCVLVDTSPGIGSDVCDFLCDVDRVFLVTTPEPTALRDTYAAFKSIVREMPGKDVLPVVNCAGEKQADQAIEALNQVTTKFLDIRIEDWHHVESDPMVVRAVRERNPLMRMLPRSPAAICIRRLSGLLMASRHESKSMAYV